MYKTIEAKLNAQNEELMQRAKVIEELKTSLSIFIDKYNKLKVNVYTLVGKQITCKRKLRKYFVLWIRFAKNCENDMTLNKKRTTINCHPFFILMII